MKVFLRTTMLTSAILAGAVFAVGQEGKSDRNSRTVEGTVAVSGYEQALTAGLARKLTLLDPKTDNAGNVWVTLGSGTPHRLIVAPIDEPGYVVSEITVDGYLPVQRLPQATPNPVFDALHFAQPVWVVTRDGKYVNGVFAGLSVHLQPGRLNPPKMNHVEELYVDIGAGSAAEVRAAGVDLLDPIALQRESFTLGDSGAAGPAAGEEVGVSTLLELAGRGREIKAKGTTTIAFVTEQWTGGRGLNRLLTQVHPDEMVFVGRVLPAASTNKDAPVEERKPGSGVVMGVAVDSKKGAESLSERLKALADKEKIPLQVVNAAAPRIAGYAKSATLPENFVVLGVPELWPVTPAETVARGGAERLEQLLSV